MSNSIGKNIILTIFGESHGPYIGAVLDGLVPGILIDEEFIKDMLSRRRPSLSTDTLRVEKDSYKIISGVFNGYTTGAPLTIIIPNENTNSKSYAGFNNTPRPGHADYVAHVKYNGFEDYRGGGHFSGRITAAIVAAGAICMQYLNSKGIYIGTHILECGKVKDQEFSNFKTDFDQIKSHRFPVISDIDQEIEDEILSVKANNDSIGGVIQTCVTNLPAGLGDPWFDSVEGVIAKAMFSIGGIKGIEFGKGFNFKNLTGSTSNDPFVMNEDSVKTTSNNNGGINGGITNGMPIVFNLAVKPTPSIGIEQNTVNLNEKTNTTLKINGRHDPAIIRRICPVVDALTAIIIMDLLGNKTI